MCRNKHYQEYKKLFEIIKPYANKNLSYKFILDYDTYVREFNKINLIQ